MTDPSTAEIIHLRINMPDNHLVSMGFLATDTVWAVKQKLFGNSVKVLQDSQNYGLFIPANNGRAAKFLDDERMLKEYQLAGIASELKYKQRLNLNIAPMKLKKLNTTSNQRDFMELVKRNEVERLDRILTKGFEPNFNNITEETPLTMSCNLPHPRSMMITLVSGGAFLDYRNKRGQTPLHVAVLNENKEAVRVLLDLGCSPNYKDKNNLTPLFYCASSNKDVHCMNMLLHERAEVDCRDGEGWTELHHACREGKSAIAEQLIFYGSDLNATNKDGNTPLHITAKFNQEAICNLLLKRGADKMLKNKSGMMASDIASINKHTAIYNRINTFSTSDVVFFTDMPTYNDKRRGTLSLSTMKNIARSRSIPNINSLFNDVIDPASTVSNSSLHNFQSNGFLPKPPPIKDRVSAIDLDWRAQTVKDAGKMEIPINHTGYEEHTYTLHKTGKAVFGFTLKGTNDSSEPNSTFKSNIRTPARNFITGVEPGKLADQVGMKDGDFLVEINGTNVAEQPHNVCVESIVKSEMILRLKVLRKSKALQLQEDNEMPTNIDASINKELQATLDNFDKILTSSPSMYHDNNSIMSSIPLSNDIKVKSTEMINQSNSSIPAPPPLPPIETLGKGCHKSMTSLSTYQESSDNSSSKPGTVRSSMGIFPDAAHDDLMEAVRKRRAMVENVDQNRLSESIENRIGRTKKIRGNITTTTTTTTNNNLNDSNLTKNTNSQSTSLLATEVKTLPKSFKKSLGDISKRGSLGDNLDTKTSQVGGEEVVQSKTLPKKSSDLLNTSNEGDFLAVAEMLRQNFIKKKQQNLNGSQFSINSSNSNGKQPSELSDEVDLPGDKHSLRNSEPPKLNEEISQIHVEPSPALNQTSSKLEEKSISIQTFENPKPINNYSRSVIIPGVIDFKTKNRPAPLPPKKPSVHPLQQSIESSNQNNRLSTPEKVENPFHEVMDAKTPVVVSPSSTVPSGNGSNSANSSIPQSPISFSDLANMVAERAAQMHKASEEKGVPIVPEHQQTGTTKRYSTPRLNFEQPKMVEINDYMSNKKVFEASPVPPTTSSNRKVFPSDGSSVSEMTKLFSSSNKPKNPQLNKTTSPRSTSQDRTLSTTKVDDKPRAGKFEMNSNKLSFSTSTSAINSVGIPSTKPSTTINEVSIKDFPPPPKEFTSDYDSKINGGVSKIKTNGTTDTSGKTTIYNSTNSVTQSPNQIPISPDTAFPVLRKTSHVSSNTMVFKAKVGNTSQQKKS